MLLFLQFLPFEFDGVDHGRVVGCVLGEHPAHLPESVAGRDGRADQCFDGIRGRSLHGFQRLVELLQTVFDALFRQFALVADGGVQVVAGDAELVGDLVQVQVPDSFAQENPVSGFQHFFSVHSRMVLRCRP